MVQLVSDRITAAINLPELMPVRTGSLLLTTALIALSYMDRLDMILLLNLDIEIPQP